MIKEFLKFFRKLQKSHVNYLLVTELDINTPQKIDNREFNKALKLILYLP